MAVSAFMITMDNTVVANALPSIQRDLGMDKSALDWVATGYILMFSCLMIAGGRITDIYGCRTAFVSGMAIFTGASAVCGLASTDTLLICGRIVQGAGAALALPATQVMITVGRTDKQRSLGTIAWVSAAGGATALGPTIGGFIVQHWHWGWIFLINIVPGVLVILLGLAVLTSKGENKDARVDLPGVLISATMLFALVYALETGRHQGWTDPAVLGVLALAAIAFGCFVLVERWAPDPMINMRFFRNRVFVGGLLSQMLWGIGFNGMIFYAATFLQRYLGFSPPKAGLVMLPSAIVVMLMTPVSFWVAAKLGPRIAIGGGMAMMAGGMVLFSMIQRDYGFGDLMPGVLVTGFGSAMCMPLVMYVLKAVPEDQAGVASGILNVIREMSGAFGIAILGLLIHDIPQDGANDATLEGFRHGISGALVLGAALVLVGAVISGLTLPSRRGWMGPKHGRRRAPAPVAAEPVLSPVPSIAPQPPVQGEPGELVGAHAPADARAHVPAGAAVPALGGAPRREPVSARATPYGGLPSRPHSDLPWDAEPSPWRDAPVARQPLPAPAADINSPVDNGGGFGRGDGAPAGTPRAVGQDGRPPADVPPTPGDASRGFDLGSRIPAVPPADEPRGADRVPPGHDPLAGLPADEPGADGPAREPGAARIETLRVSSRGGSDTPDPVGAEPVGALPPEPGPPSAPWWQREPAEPAEPAAWPPPPPEGWYSPYIPDDVPRAPRPGHDQPDTW